jgi:hypothetical protein
MILLTFDATISDKFAGALFEFEVIHFCFAARGTAHHHAVGRYYF